jgi:ATP-dependent DNA helicase RecG
VRVGSTNRRADDALIAEMRRFAQGQAFDETAMPGLDSEAIDIRAASESFAGVSRIGRRDLPTLPIVTEHQGRLVPTSGGILLYRTIFTAVQEQTTRLAIVPTGHRSTISATRWTRGS